MRSGVTRGATALMLAHATRNVKRPTGVNRTIGAFQEIDEGSAWFHSKMKETLKSAKGAKRAKDFFGRFGLFGKFGIFGSFGFSREWMGVEPTGAV